MLVFACISNCMCFFVDYRDDFGFVIFRYPEDFQQALQS